MKGVKCGCLLDFDQQFTTSDAKYEKQKTTILPAINERGPSAMISSIKGIASSTGKCFPGRGRRPHRSRPRGYDGQSVVDYHSGPSGRSGLETSALFSTRGYSNTPHKHTKHCTGIPSIVYHGMIFDTTPTSCMQIEPRVERLVQPMIHPFTDEHDFRFDMLLVGPLFRLGGPAVGTMGMGMDMFLVQLLDLKEIRYSLEDIFPSIRPSYEPLCPQDLDRSRTGPGDPDVDVDVDVPTQAGRHGPRTRHGRAARAAAEFREVG